MAIITRACTKCGRSFPATAEFFYLRRETVAGKQYEYLRRECHECWQAQAHRNYVPKIRQPKPKKEFRTCTKCKRSFPATTEFFRVAVTVVKGKRYEGLRGDCDECRRAGRQQHYHGNEYVRIAVNESTKRRRQREDVREHERAYGREKQRQKRSTEEGAMQSREQIRAWRADNPDRYAIQKKKASEAMGSRRNADFAMRRTTQLQATPPWVRAEDTLPFYVLARKLTVETGIKHCVDHIWPLKHKDYCGLHVPANLQVMTFSENSAKKNWVPSSWQ